MRILDIADGKAIRIIRPSPWTDWADKKLRQYPKKGIPMAFLQEWHQKLAACLLLNSLDPDFTSLSIQSFYESRSADERALESIAGFEPVLGRYIASRKSKRFRLISGYY